MGYYTNNPKIRVIAPWREWDLKSRNDLIKYEMSQIKIPKEKLNDPPYSMDANLLHTSYEGKIPKIHGLSQMNQCFQGLNCEEAPDAYNYDY